MINQSDLSRIAGALSGLEGNFSISDLVSYGQTVVVKPGATTDRGVPVTGAKVQAALGADFQVFPLAVEYAPGADDALGAVAESEDEIDTLEAEVEAVGATFGATAATERRLVARYMRVYARFQKCQQLLAAGKPLLTPAARAAANSPQLGIPVVGPFIFLANMIGKKDERMARRARRCDKLLKRLSKIRARMVKKGIAASRLPDPRAVGKSLARSLTQEAPVVSVVTAAPQMPWVPTAPQRAPLPYQYPQYQPSGGGGGYTPTSQAVSPYYLADQAALEREMQATTPSYFGDTEDLAADLRASTMGYAHSTMEHDYFGVAGGDTEILFADTDADPDADVLGDDDDMGAEVSDDDLASMDDDDDVLMGADDDMGGRDPGNEDDIDEAFLDAMGDDDMGDDDMGDDMGDDDMGADLSDEEFVAMDDDDDVTYGDDEMGTSAKSAAREAMNPLTALKMLNPVEVVKAAQRAGRSVKRLSRGAAQNLNRDRQRLAKQMQQAARRRDHLLAAQLRAQLAKVEARLQKGSPNGGVDYGRIQPRGEATEGPVVLVIGIRKRGGQGLGTRNSSSPMLAALGAEMYEATQGYTGPEAVAEMRFATVPSDFLRGEGAFPMGGDAPLPPPRRVGPEVYGG